MFQNFRILCLKLFCCCQQDNQSLVFVFPGSSRQVSQECSGPGTAWRTFLSLIWKKRLIHQRFAQLIWKIFRINSCKIHLKVRNSLYLCLQYWQCLHQPLLLCSFIFLLLVSPSGVHKEPHWFSGCTAVQQHSRGKEEMTKEFQNWSTPTTGRDFKVPLWWQSGFRVFR